MTATLPPAPPPGPLPPGPLPPNAGPPPAGPRPEQPGPATAAAAGPAADAPERPVDAAVRRAVAHLRGLQDAAGWWKGDLETNVTMDAEDLLLRHFLGIGDPEGCKFSDEGLEVAVLVVGLLVGRGADTATTAAVRAAADPTAASAARRPSGR